MKISKKLEKAFKEDRCFWSFEYFPPKTPQGVMNLYDRLERMYQLGPEFIDVTWGAGGSTSDVTLEICATAQAVYGLETCMHLTCTNMGRDKVDEALKAAKLAGIQNILALRGDPPRGQLEWTAVDSGFSNAIDLVKYIRSRYGDYFCIGVAGYPEGHIDNPDKEADFDNFVRKCKAGADYIVTQLFYDCDVFLEWERKIRAAGVDIPILPGIMPIQSYNGFARMTSLCKTLVPQKIYDDLEPIKEDDAAVKEYGVQQAIEMCNYLKERGMRGFHFYTLNLEKSVRLILEGLGFVAPVEIAKPLPWNPSLAEKRKDESVRPIFWKNRARSYILRTESWDDFPNGRWGDSRSPAYGNLDGYGVSLKYTKKEALEMWKDPTKVSDICDLFARYVSNQLPALPWSDAPLAHESDAIRDKLAQVNHQGFLTINSQPAVDGVRSDDAMFGWGPRNGYVYQKAYLEFFVCPKVLDALIRRIKNVDGITYYAVNKDGDLRTNTISEGANAVTWGVFPGREVLQPTIVESQSFLAWKDEAYDLWLKWRDIYPKGAEAQRVIQHVYDTWFLVNIVDNDYKRKDGIFELLDGLQCAEQ
ncbi:methylenetetrahydrofolate reduct [Gonapodya prolifera JEL478]|uniref:Methylenetetrahydrofolate reduct n=1 Tax=Gonapodya prolifera (strain JEL478) TaxID=1344416 RepID=A0A139AU08_GONPJ|nr:methylenetetrahydrofolate reduct [Gonapodya prolifera JEL478]|eukprot:KXS20211.1 methylenetetrahydrofolate reduct [Gonapodya prolifera JEL478]